MEEIGAFFANDDSDYSDEQGLTPKCGVTTLTAGNKRACAETSSPGEKKEKTNK